MAYRSDVVLVVDRRIEGMLMHLFTSCPGAHTLCHEDCDEKREREDGIMFRWNSIKWYDAYPHIAAIEAFMEKLDEGTEIEVNGQRMQLDELYRFVRVGEDNTDIDSRGYGFQDIYPYTSINVEF